MGRSDHLRGRWISYPTVPVEYQPDRPFRIQRCECGAGDSWFGSAPSRASGPSRLLSLTGGPAGVAGHLPRPLSLEHAMSRARVGEGSAMSPPNSYVLTCIKCVQWLSAPKSCSDLPPSSPRPCPRLAPSGRPESTMDMAIAAPVPLLSI